MMSFDLEDFRVCLHCGTVQLAVAFGGGCVVCRTARRLPADAKKWMPLPKLGPYEMRRPGPFDGKITLAVKHARELFDAYMDALDVLLKPKGGDGMHVEFAHAPGDKVRDKDSGIAGVIKTALIGRGGDKGYWIRYADADGKDQELYADESAVEKV